MRVGVISDTHGLLRPEALRALAGCERILHAGDIGKPEVLDALARIAPVVAVRGNNDAGAWAEKLPASEVVELGGVSLYLLHCSTRFPSPIRALLRCPGHILRSLLGPQILQCYQDRFGWALREEL